MTGHVSGCLKKMPNLFLIAVIIGCALGLRLYAANRLPVDHDEPVYLEAALQYNHFIREGRWTMLTWNETNAEHPAFYKIVYGVALLSKPPITKISLKDFNAPMPIQKAPGKPWGMVGRIVSVIFGSLTALALAAVNPLAGLFFAVNTLAVKFTSSFFLEALPVFASLMGMICYLRWAASTDEKKPWLCWLELLFSATFFGIALASKYTYAVVPAAAGVHAFGEWIGRRRNFRRFLPMLAWGIFVLAAFFVCDPYLWKHTIQRLADTFAFHTEYSQSYWVIRYNYPFWQPILWLSAPLSRYFPAMRAAFPVKVDLIISLLALVGLPRLFLRQRAYFYWLVIGLVTLLVWPTKWPQYTMIMIVPFCLSAAVGVEWIWDEIKTRLGSERLAAKVGE